MVKRSVKVKTGVKGRKESVPTGASRPPKAAVTHEEMLDPTLAKQSFSSEQQALEFFTESIAAKLEQDPAQRADMQQFLRVLLDTDPLLREELLGGLNVKK
jgi:hypothetical protein